MLIVSSAAYAGHLQLDSSFAWLGTPSALTMLSVAALAEVLAYYLPVIDNLLDTLATPATLIAGTIVSAAVMTDVPPIVKWTAAVIAGGGIAGLTQGLTGILRAHSTRFDGWSREPRHRDCGAWRCSSDILSGTDGAGCRSRAGHPVLVSGNTSAPPVISKSEIIGQPEVMPALARFDRACALAFFSRGACATVDGFRRDRATSPGHARIARRSPTRLQYLDVYTGTVDDSGLVELLRQARQRFTSTASGCFKCAAPQ